MSAEEFDRVLRHVWSEPKFVAQVEWMKDHPGIVGQMMEQGVSRSEIEGYIDGEGWEHPDREVTLVVHEMPNFDWWEPRHDQPWRRQAARDRGESK